ncbi:chorismate mutase [Solobacterium sp.]|uniref:chorismate mutase n=1 Tax=Solobacterium sp. TaxID=2060878 RepID=UPI001CB6649F|nr:chorismate mutase [Solobacterium sp.]MBF1084998.1 chorismate mutase [Solobacterium sp.]MBF1107965.1 chorismate mutase [Solobacterium sp.]
MMTLLDEKRLEINDIDAQLVHLFEQRMHAVESIIQYKLEHQLPILDTGREAQNILRTKALLHDSCLSDYFESWYRYTMQVSKEYQKEIKEKHNQK